MNAFKKTILILVILFISTVVSANQIACMGIPKEVVIWGNGQSWIGIWLEGQSGPWIVCDLNNDVGGVSSKNCSAIYSAALAKEASSKPLKLIFNGDIYSSCSEIPAWDTSLPPNFYLLRTGE